MSDGPPSGQPLKAVKDTVESISDTVKSRLSILSDGKRCPACGTEMDATQAYDPTEGAFYDGGYRPAYVCDECGYKERREEDRVTFNPYK